jgi:hypothetical protein
VLSGDADGVPVDFGGGPLAPIGTTDAVIGELDASGAHVWSRRIGAPGAVLGGARVTVSQAGNVYVQMLVGGPVDFGGGPVAAALDDIVVASYTPSGAHRWSRAFHVTGQYQAGVDGCGSLVVASPDWGNFDAGYGKVGMQGSGAWYAAVVRFAP